MVNEELDKKFLHLMKIGLVNRAELSKYKLAFKDPEANVKFEQYRSKILDVFEKIRDIIINNSSIYDKVKQQILRQYGAGKMDKEEIEEGKTLQKIVSVFEEKSELYGVDINTIIEVYNRGISYVEEHGASNKSPEQYAFDRVNSFLNNGVASKIDEDLMEAAKKGPGRPRTREVKRFDSKKASTRSLAAHARGDGPNAREAARELLARKRASAKTPKRVAARQLATSTKDTDTKQLQKMINAVPRGAVKAELRKVLGGKEAIKKKNKVVLDTSKDSYKKMATMMSDPKRKESVTKWIKSKSASSKLPSKSKTNKGKPQQDFSQHKDYEDLYNSIYSSSVFGRGYGPEKKYQAKIEAHEKTVELLKKAEKSSLSTGVKPSPKKGNGVVASAEAEFKANRAKTKKGIFSRVLAKIRGRG